jgi:hypothetical protein
MQFAHRGPLRGSRRLLLVNARCTLAGLILLALAGGAGVRAADDWKFDVVYRKAGKPLIGLVTEQTPRCLRLRCVSRKPGAPTIVYPVEVDAGEVERVELLPDRERTLLRQRLDNLREERKVLVERLHSLDTPGRPAAAPREIVSLRSVPWPADPKQSAWSHESTHFRLISNARRELVELAAIHLTQIYEAYVRFLPPRVEGRPTTILLPQAVEEYQRIVSGNGRNLANPAFYDSGKNQVVCLCALQRLADDLEKARRHHAQLHSQLVERESQLRQAYHGRIPAEIRTPLEETRQQIAAATARNQAVFGRARQRLFQRLYHEAFHAYLATFVYPAGGPQPPRWLNEGLAQIFETALVEAGELRIGHADPERLQAVQASLNKDALLPLTDLLRSGSRHFIVAHELDRRTSDRHYLASWALAFYLTFERKLLGTPALDGYIHALHRGVDPVQACSELFGQPVPGLEKAFHDYLGHLRLDGTVRRGS